jgi:hypothetical protein
MPVYPCPECDKKLKTPDGAEGKKLRCPSCETMLVITEDGLEPAGGAKPAAKGSSKVTAKPAKKRVPDDDDDDRPSKKRSRDDDDDDDGPRKKRSRDDDDDDDEDDDEGPRKKRKGAARRGRSGGGMGMWLWIGGGVGALAVVLVILFVFVLGGGSKFDQIKAGMTEKEVKDILGEPAEGDTRSVATWFHPSLSKSDMQDPMKALASFSKIKEILTVQFAQGKVTRVNKVSVDDFKKKFGGGGLPF